MRETARLIAWKVLTPVITTTRTIGRWLIGLLIAALPVSGLPISGARAAVTLEHTTDGWRFAADGAPLTVRGAAVANTSLPLLQGLAATGATAVRTYGPDQAGVLATARAAGLRVLFGLDLQPARRGFDYADAKVRQAEIDRLLPAVRAHKDDPALLAWGVGNEVETGAADPRIAWAAADALAQAVHTVDPAHPTVLVVGDGGPETLTLINAATPHIDVIGINAYAGAALTAADRLRAAGITRPLLIGELGSLGQWQAGRKPWGAPVELTSTQKATFYADILPKLAHDPRIAGTFVFLWGAKQEQTATWHGLLLADGTRLGPGDAMTLAWTGQPPVHPVPVIKGIGINADVFAPGAPLSAGIDVTGTGPMTYQWSVTAEARDLRIGGDAETPPSTLPLTFTGTNAVTGHAPQTPGAYRLFVVVRDSTGGAATANLPFLVQ